MSDLIARGMATQAMSYNPAFLSTLGRPPRVLVIGESILADSLFLQRLQAIIPNAQVERRTYSGSFSAMGMLIAANDVQAPIVPGQLLPKSVLTSWGASNCTLTQAYGPSIGRNTYLVNCSGVSQQGLTLNGGTVFPAVPSPVTGSPSLKGTDGNLAPFLCFSVEIEPGTLQTFRITVFNHTVSGGVITQQDFVAANASNRAEVQARYNVVIDPTMQGVGNAATWSATTAYALNQVVIPTTPNGFYYVCTTAGTSGATQPTWPTTNGATVTDGSITWTAYVGYKVGDQLSVSIGIGADESPTAWVSGTMYVSNPMLNVGVFPAPYFPTTATAQSPGSLSWQSAAVGTDRRAFDLAIVQFGRNDAGGVPAVDHEKILSGIVSSISQFCPRVMIITPCPLANSSTPTAWNIPADNYQNDGLHAVALRVAYKHGCYLYDAWSDFQNQVSNGTYQVSDIMRDQYHPTNVTLSSPGMQLFIKAIANVLNSSKDSPVRALGSMPMARIGGTPGAGNFAWTVLSGVTTPTSDPSGVHIGHQKEPFIGVYQSTTVNDTLTFTVTGTIIGLIVVNDSGTPGTLSVQIDGGLPTLYTGGSNSGNGTFNISTNAQNEPKIPFGYIVATGLQNASHTVTVTNTSGTVWVMACVAV